MSELSWMKRKDGYGKKLPEVDENYEVHFPKKELKEGYELLRPDLSKICIYCNEQFYTKNNSKKYCSSSCVSKELTRKKREERELERSERSKMYSRPYNLTTCEILKDHHEELKEDPEHLSCNFLKKIIGVDC